MSEVNKGHIDGGDLVGEEGLHTHPGFEFPHVDEEAAAKIANAATEEAEALSRSGKEEKK